MYAVIQTGGKQARVAEGDRVEVELLGQEPGSEVAFRPVLLVDGDTVVTIPPIGRASVAGPHRQLHQARRSGASPQEQYQPRKRWGTSSPRVVEITGSRGSIDMAKTKRGSTRTARPMPSTRRQALRRPGLNRLLDPVRHAAPLSPHPGETVGAAATTRSRHADGV